MNKRIIFIVSMLIVVCSVFGFAFAQNETIEVTDMKGRTVTLPAEINKVVVTFNMEE